MMVNYISPHQFQQICFSQAEFCIPITTMHFDLCLGWIFLKIKMDLGPAEWHCTFCVYMAHGLVSVLQCSSSLISVSLVPLPGNHVSDIIMGQDRLDIKSLVNHRHKGINMWRLQQTNKLYLAFGTHSYEIFLLKPPLMMYIICFSFINLY